MIVDPTAIAVAKGATQVALYASALTIIGAGVCRAWILGRAGLSTGDADARAGRAAAAAAVALLAAVTLRLYVQVIDSYLTLLPSPEMLRLLIFSTRTWGIGMLTQLLIALGLVAVTRAARRPGAVARGASLATAIAAALAVPLTGHAAAHGGAGGIAAQGLHVFAVGAWIGALGVLLRATAAVPAAALAPALAAFSPVARLAAATVVAGGVTALLSHVGTEGLLGSRYGWVLATKVALFAGIAAAGYVNWRQHTPRLADLGGREALLRTARIELLLAAAALVVTAVLTAIGRPGD